MIEEGGEKVQVPADSSGHGHVTPRPDGIKARCGGPGVCSICNAELGQVWRMQQSEYGDEAMPATHRPIDEKLVEKVERLADEADRIIAEGVSRAGVTPDRVEPEAETRLSAAEAKEKGKVPVLGKSGIERWPLTDLTLGEVGDTAQTIWHWSEAHAMEWRDWLDRAIRLGFAAGGIHVFHHHHFDGDCNERCEFARVPQPVFMQSAGV